MEVKKKKILMVTSGFAPVPAVLGGAVETLSTYLIQDNEVETRYEFTVLTLKNKRIMENEFKHTQFIQIYVSNIERLIEKIINKIFRMMSIKKEILFFNMRAYVCVKNMIKRGVCFDYVLYENSMDQFKKINRLVSSKSKSIFHLHNDIGGVSKSIEMCMHLSQHVDKIIFVSEFLRQSFQRQVPIESTKCKLLYNCVEMDNTNNIVGGEVRKELGIREEDKVICYIGRINAEKGVLELARAFSMLEAEGILMICGGTWGNKFKKNKYLKEIKSVLDKAKNRKLFTGYVEHKEIQKYYAASDIVVIPSKAEPFGMVILEAAVNRKAIIATRAGGMPELLPEEAVIWVDNGENIVTELRHALELLINNDEKREEIAAIAYNHVAGNELFSRAKYFESFDDIMRDEMRDEI